MRWRWRGLVRRIVLGSMVSCSASPWPAGAREHATIKHLSTFLAVQDVSRSAKFYRAAFGWKVRLEVPVLVEFELPDGKGLGLYQRESFALNTKQAPVEVKTGKITGTELYFGVDDLDAAIERLKTAGARVLSEKAARDWGDVAAYFSDPDGNVLVVSHPAK